MFTRENAKYIHLKIEKYQQRNEAGLLCGMRSHDSRPYVEGANGETRELLSFPKCPPWQTRVEDMDFPLTLNFIEPSSCKAAAPISQEVEEASTPKRPLPASRDDEAKSAHKQSRAAASRKVPMEGTLPCSLELS